MPKLRKVRIIKVGAARRLTRGDVGGRLEISGPLEQPAT
jgi:hypothetical protein